MIEEVVKRARHILATFRDISEWSLYVDAKAVDQKDGTVMVKGRYEEVRMNGTKGESGEFIIIFSENMEPLFYQVFPEEVQTK